MYIKKGEPLLDGMQQKFEHYPTSFGSVSENTVLRMFDQGMIEEIHLDIMYFLFDVRMALTEQIYRYLEDEYPESTVDEALKWLIGNHFINRFMICDHTENKIKLDAEMIYTLDFGAIGLLKHITNDEIIDTWRATSLIEVSSKVNKELMITDLYVELRKQLGENFLYFKSQPFLQSRSVSVIPRALIAVKYNNKIKYYFIECVREYDIVHNLETNESEKISRIGQRMVDRAYIKLNILEEPGFILLGESLKSVKTFGDDLVYNGLENAWVCTNESIREGKYYRYDNKQLSEDKPRGL